MAKKGNATTLAPSAGEGWDAWGAACGFTSWAQAAGAIGITVAHLVTVRKKAPRKTIRLAMASVLAAKLRAMPDEAVASFVESAAVIIEGHTFPSGKSLYKAREISDLALRMLLAAAPSPGEPRTCNRNCDCVGPCKMGDAS